MDAPHVVVLGAGFGGLELATSLSEELGDQVRVTLIDKSDGFLFGFSKLDVLYGRASPETVILPYRAMVKPGVTFRQETVLEIDPERRRVVTDAATVDADILVVALGADYDIDATPGLRDGGNEFYSLAGATELGRALSAFDGGTAVVAVMSPVHKCPPAPTEASLLLDDYLRGRGIRDRSRIVMVSPFGLPLPVSDEAGRGILQRFDEVGIEFVGGSEPSGVDPAARTLGLRDGTAIGYDLLMAVPVHAAPEVVRRSGLTANGWIPVNPSSLETRFANVFAIGDVTSVGTPRAGVFAENAAKVVARRIAARVRGGDVTDYQGDGHCYIEFGGGQVAEIYVNFLGGPQPWSDFRGATPDGAREKARFGASRRQRWFGL